jgi:adenylate kinase
MKNIIMIGAPGAGKGTQSKKLAEGKKLYHLSTGNIIRKEISQGSEKGKHFASIIDAGLLLTNEEIFPIVGETIKNYFSSKGEGIIYDGFPRTVSHAEFLEKLLSEIKEEVSIVIHIAVTPEILLKRIEGRLICNRCNESYNIFFRKPLKEGMCDFCLESVLEKRNDDSVSSFNKRLKIYEKETYPVLDFYRKKNLVREVEGEKSNGEVFSQLIKIIEEFV